MAKEIKSSTQTKQVLIPMIVDRDAFNENGIIAGITRSQIRKWKVGNRKEDVVLVPGTKEQYAAIMADYSRQFKAEDRDKRCSVSGNNGKLIRCDDRNKCSACPYHLTRDEYGTALFSSLAKVDEDGELHDFDPAAPENYYDSDKYIRLLEDLVRHVSEIDPQYGTMIKLLHDGYSRRDVAAKMDLPKSTVNDKVNKLHTIAKSFFETIPY